MGSGEEWGQSLTIDYAWPTSVTSTIECRVDRVPGTVYLIIDNMAFDR